MFSYMRRISVIVPVYNVSKYLKKCLDSIIKQSYNNLEIILVDDGSTDDSGKICDEYSTIDNRILVIHKNNGGLSSARNAALDISTGAYVGFVDSDDWIESTMYEEMCNLLEREQCDYVECAVNLYSNSEAKIIKGSGFEIISGKEALSRHLDEYVYYDMPRPAVWSKLYRRDFWDGKRFPEGRIHEDYLLTCKLLYESDKVGLLHKGLYNHLVSNPTSIMNTKFGVKDLYKVNQYEYRINYLLNHHEKELAEKAQVKYYCFLLIVCYKCRRNKLVEEKVYLDIFKRDKKIIRGLNIPPKRRLEIAIINFSPSLYYFLRSIISI